MKTDRIDALTGLRCLAALSIFAWHLRGYFVPENFFEPFYPAGAVPLFFVLSGFVLSVGGMRGRSWSEFFVSRFARIWPAHMAALALLFVAFWPWSLAYFKSTESAVSLLLNVALVQDWFPGIFGDYNGVAWSISAEMFFYAMFPLLFVLTQKWPLRVLAAISVVSIGWTIGMSKLFPSIRLDWLAMMNPVVGLWAFVFGVLCGTRYECMARFVRNIRPLQWMMIEIAVLALAIAANGSFLMIGFGHKALDAFFADLGAAPYYALLVLTLALSCGPLARFLSTRQMVYMGEVSFSFYLVHQIVIRWYADHVSLFNKPLGFAFVLGASSAAAALIFHAVEKPARTAIVNAWKRQQYNQPLQRKA